MKSFIAPLTITVSFLSTHLSSAFPYGAGSCVDGPAVLGKGSPHKKADKGGSWAESGYQIVINGTNLFLEGTEENYYKGFLFRLSAKNESAARKMDLLDDYMQVSQLLESNGEMIGAPGRCGWDVCGISHTENSKKMKVGIKLKLKKGVEYKLGFTVVKEWDVWYYASRKILYDGNSILLVGVTLKSHGETLNTSASTTQSSPYSPTPTSSSNATNSNPYRASAMASAAQASSGATSASSTVLLMVFAVFLSLFFCS